jgi:RimJ/RimL family protein N-acetyltransferase
LNTIITSEFIYYTSNTQFYLSSGQAVRQPNLPDGGLNLRYGEIYLANPDWHVPSLELGYFVVRASTGKGFATEAARATLHYAFDHMQVSRVDLQCRSDNEASQRVAGRCGFRLEGCQRLRHCKKDGMLVDRLWYGLLRSEWQAGP